MPDGSTPNTRNPGQAAKRKRGRRNKRLKETGTKKDFTVALNPSEMLDAGRNCLASRDFIWLSIDLEWHESSRNAVTEIGLALLDSSPQYPRFMPRIRCFHLLPIENYEKRNGKHVPDNRDCFAHGTTYRMPLSQCFKFLQKFVHQYASSNRPFFYVGHGLTSDFLTLRANGLTLDPAVPTLDTELLLRQMTMSGNSVSLGNACSSFHIDTGLLHNAGNDAHATMCLLINLCDDVVRGEFFLNKKLAEASAYRKVRAEAKKTNKQKEQDYQNEKASEAQLSDSDPVPESPRPKLAVERQQAPKKPYLDRLEAKRSRITRGSAGYSEIVTPQALLHRLVLPDNGLEI